MLPSWPTCAFPYDGVEFGAEKSLSVVEDELHHHRLDAHLHEGGRAAETRRLDLPRPGGDRRAVKGVRDGNPELQGDDRPPEEIGSPDDRQVFGVHVGGGAEGGQVREMPHEVFQSPVGGKMPCVKLRHPLFFKASHNSLNYIQCHYFCVATFSCNYCFFFPL